MKPKPTMAPEEARQLLRDVAVPLWGPFLRAGGARGDRMAEGEPEKSRLRRPVPAPEGPRRSAEGGVVC